MVGLMRVLGTQLFNVGVFGRRFDITLPFLIFVIKRGWILYLFNIRKEMIDIPCWLSGCSWRRWCYT